MSAQPHFPVRVLWRLAMGQPQLLAAHAVHYAALLRDEGSLSVALMQQRLTLLLLAFLAATTGTVLSGVAAMLWATAAPSAVHATWVLLVTPAVPWILAGWAWSRAKRLGPLPLWAAWQAQVDADEELLRQFSAR